LLGVLILLVSCDGQSGGRALVRAIATPDAAQIATLTAWPTAAPLVTLPPTAAEPPHALWTAEPTSAAAAVTPASATATAIAPRQGTPSPTPGDSSTASQAGSGAAGDPFGSLSQAIRLRIPAVDLDVPVHEVSWEIAYSSGGWRAVWQTADGAAGHHRNSANPGEAGNVVLSGHHNSRGEVFRPVSEIGLPGARFGLGDLAFLVSADGREYAYRVVQWDRFVADADLDLETHYLAQTPDPILTLVTCWPYEDNTHRVVVILALKP